VKKFLIGVLLSFVMFALSFSLFSGFSFFIAIFPIAVLAVPFICAVTEALIFFIDEKWGFKWDGAVVLGIATITTLPFYPSCVLVASIYIGALGYYVGRRIM
jgi:hypothetical protein